MSNTDLVPLNLDQKGPWTIYHGATDWLQWKWIRLIVFHFRQIQCWAKRNHLNIMYWESGCPFCIRDLLPSYDIITNYFGFLPHLWKLIVIKAQFPWPLCSSIRTLETWCLACLVSLWPQTVKSLSPENISLPFVQFIVVLQKCLSSATSSEFTGVITLEHPGVKCFAQGSSIDTSWLASCGKLATS